MSFEYPRNGNVALLVYRYQRIPAGDARGGEQSGGDLEQPALGGGIFGRAGGGVLSDDGSWFGRRSVSDEYVDVADVWDEYVRYGARTIFAGFRTAWEAMG